MDRAPNVWHHRLTARLVHCPGFGYTVWLRHRLHNREIVVRYPAGTRDILLLQNVHTACGPLSLLFKG